MEESKRFDWTVGEGERAHVRVQNVLQVHKVVRARAGPARPRGRRDPHGHAHGHATFPKLVKVKSSQSQGKSIFL